MLAGQQLLFIDLPNCDASLNTTTQDLQAVYPMSFIELKATAQVIMDLCRHALLYY